MFSAVFVQRVLTQTSIEGSRHPQAAWQILHGLDKVQRVLQVIRLWSALPVMDQSYLGSRRQLVIHRYLLLLSLLDPARAAQEMLTGQCGMLGHCPLLVA